METARGMGDAPPRVEEKPEWWASTSVVGLMGFGLTTMMAGLSNLPAPYGNGFAGNWAVYGLAIFFGGMAQLIAGVIALRKGNMFAGSAFMGYGAFWLAFWQLTTNAALGGGLGAVPGAAYAVSAFAFFWMMFTLTFLINSMKHGWGIFAVFLFLFISFILLVVKFWQIAAGNTISTGEGWAVGGIITLTGLIAWYVATADLTNWNYGRKVLPV
jgi:uncharacterized protein